MLFLSVYDLFFKWFYNTIINKWVVTGKEMRNYRKDIYEQQAAEGSQHYIIVL